MRSEHTGVPNPDDVPMTLDRLARLALTATLAFGVAACAVVEEPVVVDSCELVVRNGDGETLEPPYETTMIRRSTGREEGWSTSPGAGGGMTQFNCRAGQSESVNIDTGGEGEETNWTATAPGHLALPSHLRSVHAVFDVEVKPVP